MIICKIPLRLSIGGGELYARLKREGITPSVERKRLMKEYGVTEEEVRRWRQ